MVDRVLVRFEGEGSGTAELAWGQRELWSAMRRQETWLPIGAVTPLPAGTTVDRVADDLRFMMSRYPTLRTRLQFGPDGPMQVVAAAGEVALEIVDTAPVEDPARVGERIWQRYHDSDFDFVADWPIRMAAIRHRGALTHLVTVMCHLVTDSAGAAVMLAELAGRDPATGAVAAPATSPMPPLEQVRWQRTPAARRVTDAALRRWEKLLRAIPARRFRGNADPQQPRYWQGAFRSAALRLATGALAARTKADSSTVLLAVFAITLAEVTGGNPVVVRVVVSNRFRPGLAETVSPVNQTGLCVLAVAGLTVDQAIAETRRRVLATYKHAYYDPWQLDALISRIGQERGEELDLACYFNDRRERREELDLPVRVPAPERLRAAAETSTFEWERKEHRPLERLFLHIDDIPGQFAVTICGDTHYLSPADLEGCVRRLEAVAVAAALARRRGAA